jgi:hypothetical protein
MGFSDKKFEITVGALVLVMVGALGYVVKTPVQKAIANADFTFEMPRPKAFFASLFDLNGREISRTYVNPFDKKKKDEAKKPDVVKALPAPKPAAAVAKKAAPKKDDAAKKPTVDVNVVQDSPHEGVGADGIRPNAKNGREGSNGAGAGDTAAADAKDATKNSADQWRALLNAQPTKENVDKMVAAFAAGELDSSSFYSIVGDLLKNNKSETQKMGVYALSSSGYKAPAFALASEYYDQLGSEAKTAAHTYLVSYATKGYLTILQGALQSTKASVVEVAAQVVIEGYQAAKSGTTTTPPRASRGDEVASSVSGYSKFIPIFQSLAQSGDAAIVQLANSALSQIQTSVASL